VKVIPKIHRVELKKNLRFYYYHWADTSADGPIISVGIIHLVVDASALAWFISFIFIEIYTVPK
jgi:hypothetical protein